MEYNDKDKNNRFNGLSPNGSEVPSHRRRGRDKHFDDYSAFGVPMKVENPNSAPRMPRSRVSDQITFDQVENELTEKETELQIENTAEQAEEIVSEAVESVEETALAETPVEDTVLEAVKEEGSEETVLEETDVVQAEEEVIINEALEEIATEEANEELPEESKDPEDDVVEAEPLEQEIAFGQIRGFGCDMSASDYEDEVEAEPTEDAETEIDDRIISDKYGIQQKFDINFLEPMADIEEVIAVDDGDEPEKAEVAPFIAAEVMAETEISKTEENTEAAELPLATEKEDIASNEEQQKGVLDVQEKTEESFAEDSVTGELTEDIPEEKAEEAPSENIAQPLTDAVDIWDEEGRAEWEAKEQFAEHCRSLVIPPLRTTKQEKVLKRRPPMHSTSSGYQYEEAERLPFDAKGRTNGEDELSYRAREKSFTESRNKKERKKLHEKAGRLLFRAWVTAAIALVLLALDCLNFVKSGDGAFISSKSVTAFCCVDIALLIISAGAAFGIIRDGITCAFKGNHIPETLTAMTVFVTLAYHGALLVIGADAPVVIGSPAALSVLFAMIYRYYMLRRDMITFDVAAHYREYTTDVKMKDFPSTPEFSEFDGYAPRESELCKINRVSRIDGICEQTPVRDTCFGFMRAVSLISFCAAIVIALAFGFIKQSISDGLFYAALTVAMSAPISVFFSMYIPRVRASASAAAEGAAIVSFNEDSSMLEKSVIMLDDGDLCNASTLSPKIDVCKTFDMEQRLNKVASLFRRLGGTLGTLLADAGFTEYEDVTLREIDAHGIYATVGETDVIAGSESYLSKYGIKVSRHNGQLSEDEGVLYVACGGRFFCRITMTFKPDLELCRRISELRNTDTLISLKSCNPCIDDALVYRTTGIEPELLRLIKYSSGDEVCPVPTDREGRLVSSKGSLGLLRAVLEYKRQRKLIAGGGRFALVSCFVGIIASVAVIVAGDKVAGFAPLIVLALHGAMSFVASGLARRKALDTKTVIKK